jgi:hypothetical protein
MNNSPVITRRRKWAISRHLSEYKKLRPRALTSSSFPGVKVPCGMARAEAEA